MGEERFCGSCGIELWTFEELPLKVVAKKQISSKEGLLLRRNGSIPIMPLLLTLGVVLLILGSWSLLTRGEVNQDLSLPRISDERAVTLVKEFIAPLDATPSCDYLGKLRGGDQFSCDFGGTQAIEYLIAPDETIGRISFGGESSSPPTSVQAAEQVLSKAWEDSLKSSGTDDGLASFYCSSPAGDFDYSCFALTESGDAAEIAVSFNSNGTIGRERVTPLPNQATIPAPGDASAYSPSCDPLSENYNLAQCDGPYDTLGP